MKRRDGTVLLVAAQLFAQAGEFCELFAALLIALPLVRQQIPKLYATVFAGSRILDLPFVEQRYEIWA